MRFLAVFVTTAGGLLLAKGLYPHDWVFLTIGVIVALIGLALYKKSN